MTVPGIISLRKLSRAAPDLLEATLVTHEDRIIGQYVPLVVTERSVAFAEDLAARVVALEMRPPTPAEIRVVEWRPEHRRQKDGGQPVRQQRREVGLPKRPRAVSA